MNQIKHFILIVLISIWEFLKGWYMRAKAQWERFFLSKEEIAERQAMHDNMIDVFKYIKANEDAQKD